MIAIVDYRMGNVGSILNMLRKVGAPAQISADAGELAQADKLILPGVGAFDSGMTNLRESGLLPVLQQHTLVRKKPILGICLGMQLLMRGSEEGQLPGLGWIAGATVRFRFAAEQAQLRIPHMGWNTITPRPERMLFRELEEDAAFYFVHSYHVVCDDEADAAATARYGYDFVCAVQRDNILGTQFHPEKSHRYGLRVLQNFAALK